MGAEFLFMDDSARPHRANIVDECLQSEDITRMDWTAYSPDLNPIEHKNPEGHELAKNGHQYDCQVTEMVSKSPTWIYRQDFTKFPLNQCLKKPLTINEKVAACAFNQLETFSFSSLSLLKCLPARKDLRWRKNNVENDERAGTQEHGYAFCLQSGPSKPVLRMSFLDESISNVGERDSSKSFSPTSSGSNTIRF
ncbi:DDE_3 domain-containing protein [Trichonephila clavipes]|nr:DDE_3 domain-containing protein [Trichonephila clavipes]